MCEFCNADGKMHRDQIHNYHCLRITKSNFCKLYFGFEERDIQ